MSLLVDVGARLITGPAVPYGRTALLGTRWHQFLPGWLENPHGPPWLLRDHDHAQRIGRIVYLAETEDGLDAHAQVFQGTLGDRALAEAAEGCLGFSPGLARGGTYEQRRGIRFVVAAELPELTLTRNPAFGLEP